VIDDGVVQAYTVASTDGLAGRERAAVGGRDL
jgi:hypothetical protein